MRWDFALVLPPERTFGHLRIYKGAARMLTGARDPGACVASRLLFLDKMPVEGSARTADAMLGEASIRRRQGQRFEIGCCGPGNG